MLGSKSPTLSMTHQYHANPVLRHRRKWQNGTLFLLKLWLLQDNRSFSQLLAVNISTHLSR